MDINVELNDDGSMVGQSFSGPEYEHGYPSPKYGVETYGEYRKRVQTDFIPKGFHLGDLSWDDWDVYCKGSGTFEGADANSIIE